MAGSTLKKFLILEWKYFLLKKRHWIQTLCEIIIPTLLFMGIVVIRYVGGPEVSPVDKPAEIELAKIYPLQYCETLLSHTANGTLQNRTFYYTNAIGNGQNTPSQLMEDIMEKVEKATEEFLWPLCEIAIVATSNVTITDAGKLGKQNVVQCMLVIARLK